MIKQTTTRKRSKKPARPALDRVARLGVEQHFNVLMTHLGMAMAGMRCDVAQAGDAAQKIAQGMAKGMAAYRASTVRPDAPQRRTVWQQGQTRILACGGRGRPLLLVPSLVNRSYILDLEKGWSFAGYMATQGFSVYLLDWGEPDDTERLFDINDYIGQRLVDACLFIAQKTRAKPALLGYCMGGTLVAAMLAAYPDVQKKMSAALFVATPWDFHAGDALLAMRVAAFFTYAMPFMAAKGVLTNDLLQALFMTVDPLQGLRKFTNFAGLDPASVQARRFVIVEDWLNDGVDLAAPAARTCLCDWHVTNTPATGKWMLNGIAVDPANIGIPSLVVVPLRDRLVPPASSFTLARQLGASQLGHATRLDLDIGHVGMMASDRAPDTAWQPIAAWLHKK